MKSNPRASVPVCAVVGYLPKYDWMLCQLSNDTWAFILGYFCGSSLGRLLFQLIHLAARQQEASYTEILKVGYFVVSDGLAVFRFLAGSLYIA